MSNYVGLDLSFAKTGVAVISVKDRKPKIELAHLITSDKDKESNHRIDDTVTEVKLIASRTNPKVILREAAIVGRSSSAIPVIKTHGVFESETSDRYRLDEVHGATIKAWARTVTGSGGKRNDKEMVAEAVLAYYGNSIKDKIYTPRGRLLDDVADAIALTTLWLEKEDLIETKFKREKAK